MCACMQGLVEDRSVKYPGTKVRVLIWLLRMESRPSTWEEKTTVLPKRTHEQSKQSFGKAFLFFKKEGNKS